MEAIETRHASNGWSSMWFRLPPAVAWCKTPGCPLGSFPAVSFRAFRGLSFSVTGKTPGGAESRDAVFEFADPASTPSNLVPGAYLESIRIDPERDFSNKETVDAATQAATARSLLTHKLDRGAISPTVLTPLSHLDYEPFDVTPTDRPSRGG